VKYGAASVCSPNAGFPAAFDVPLQSTQVSLDHARLAAAWCDYLERHARRVYSCVVTHQMRAAQVLAEKLRKRRIGGDGYFSLREAYLKGWSGLDSSDKAQQAATVLTDARWIRPVHATGGPEGGRPAERYEVNPRIWWE
jgi:hypothetical protein